MYISEPIYTVGEFLNELSKFTETHSVDTPISPFGNEDCALYYMHEDGSVLLEDKEFFYERIGKGELDENDYAVLKLNIRTVKDLMNKWLKNLSPKTAISLYGDDCPCIAVTDGGQILLDSRDYFMENYEEISGEELPDDL